MDLSKICLYKINWCSQSRTYKPCYGRYFLNLKKQTRLSKNAINFWVKKYDYIDLQIKIKIEIFKSNLVISYKFENDKKVKVSSSVIMFEPNFSNESALTFESNATVKKRFKNYILLATFGKDFFFVHLAEAVH